MNKDENMKSPNTESEIKIRKARPNFEEGLTFARLFDITAEGFFTNFLGKDAFDVIAEAYVKPGNEYSYENVAFAVEGESICGMLCGYTFETKQQFQQRILDQSTRGDKKVIRRFQMVASMLKRAMGAKHPGEYYLHAIVVTEAYRGRGLGKKLMQWIETDARDKGAQTLSLDVSSKNSRAIELYKRQGMTVDSRWPRFPLLPSLFTRMVKNI